MARQKKTTTQKRRGARRTTGAIRVRTRRSAYAARIANAPRDSEVAAGIDAAIRAGEALRLDIERRIEADLVGY